MLAALRVLHVDTLRHGGTDAGHRGGLQGIAGRGLTHKIRGLPSRISPARPIRQLWEAPVFTERTSVGLDVHARSVAAAAIDGVTGELFQSRLTPSYEHIRSLGPGSAGSGGGGL